MNRKNFIGAALLGLIFVAGGWGESGSIVKDDLVITAMLPAQTGDLTANNSAQIEVRLQVDLARDQLFVSPFNLKDPRQSVAITSNGLKVFSGHVDWIVIGSKGYFAPQSENTAALSGNITAISPLAIKGTSSPSGRIDVTGLAFGVDAVTIYANQTLSQASGLVRSTLSFDNLVGQIVYLGISENVKQSPRQFIAAVSPKDLTYWKKVKEFWGESPTTVQRIKNTLFRTLLTDSALDFFDRDYDVEKFNQIVSDRPTYSLRFLDDFSRLTFTQLGLHFDKDSQTLRIPTDALYSVNDSTTSSMVKDYFTILQKQNQTKELSSADARDIAASALKYLYEPENRLSNINSLSDNIKPIQDEFDALYGSSTEVWLSKLDQAKSLSKIIATSASNAQLTIQKVNGEPVTANSTNELFFLPKSPNFLVSSNFSDSSVDKNVLWESPSVEATSVSQSQFTLNFIQKQKFSYLAFWANDQFSISSIKESNRACDTLIKTLETISNSDGIKKIVTQDQKVGGVYQLYLVTLKDTHGLPITELSNLTLQFGSGTKIVKMAAYKDAPVFDYGWKSDQGTSTFYNVATYRVSEVQFIQSQPQKTISFLTWGYQSSPVSQSPDSDFFPIRYAFGGWETPKSYATKILVNRVEKVRRGLKSKFPFTEHDAFQTGPVVDDLGKYSASPNDLLRSLRTEYSASDSRIPYVYSYGLDFPYSSTTMTNTNSPFFVEKLAGVDSLGMLSSILFQNQLVPQFPGIDSYSLSGRWQARTSTINQFKDFFPYQNSNYDVATLPQIATPTVTWYERNSSVVVDLSTIRPGDLLVGYEGSSLESAVIVWTPSPSWISSNSLDDLKQQVLVVGINRGLKAAILTTWANFSSSVSGYHVRRLIQNGNVSSALFSKPREITTPQGARVWIPDTSEMVPLGQASISVSGGANGVIPVIPLSDGFDKLKWSVGDIEAVDYNYSTDSIAFNNKVDNGPTQFYLVAYAEDRKDSPINKDILDHQSSYPNAVVLARYTSQDGTREMLAKSLYDPTKYSLECTRGNKDLGYSHRLLVRHNGAALDRFGIFVVNPHPGDDIQFTFKVGGAIVYRTMPMTVYSWMSLTYYERVDFVYDKISELRNGILAETQLTDDERRIALDCVAYLQTIESNDGLEQTHTAYDQRFLSEAVMREVFAYFVLKTDVTESQVPQIIAWIDLAASGTIDFHNQLADRLGMSGSLWIETLRSAFEIGMSAQDLMAIAVSSPANAAGNFGLLSPQKFTNTKIRQNVEESISDVQPGIVANLRFAGLLGKLTSSNKATYSQLRDLGLRAESSGDTIYFFRGTSTTPIAKIENHQFTPTFWIGAYDAKTKLGYEQVATTADGYWLFRNGESFAFDLGFKNGRSLKTEEYDEYLIKGRNADFPGEPALHGTYVKEEVLPVGTRVFVVEDNNSDRPNPGTWGSSIAVYTITDLRNILAVKNKYKDKDKNPTLREYRVQIPLRVRSSITGPQYEDGKTLPGGGPQYEFIPDEGKSVLDHLGMPANGVGVVLTP